MRQCTHARPIHVGWRCGYNLGGHDRMKVSKQMTLRLRAFLGLAILAAGAWSAWSGWPLWLPPTCAFRLTTGLPCAACGMTHACCAMAHGDIPAAMGYHIGVVPFAAAA